MGHPMFDAWLIGCLIAVRLVQIGKARPARLRTAQPQNWLALQAPPLRDIWVVKGLLSTIGDKSREAI